MRKWSTFVLLAICLGLSLQAKAFESLEQEEAAGATTWTEIHEPKKGATCLDTCLADGEELFDCEYFCIQTAQIGPTSPRLSCSR